MGKIGRRARRVIGGMVRWLWGTFMVHEYVCMASCIWYSSRTPYQCSPDVTNSYSNSYTPFLTHTHVPWLGSHDRSQFEESFMPLVTDTACLWSILSNPAIWRHSYRLSASPEQPRSIGLGNLKRGQWHVQEMVLITPDGLYFFRARPKAYRSVYWWNANIEYRRACSANTTYTVSEWSRQWGKASKSFI